MEYIIEVKNVTKKYGANIVLNDVTVSFEKGKIHGLIGRNGSGKTMLIKCICGFVTPSSGEILINGEKVKNNSAQLENIGAIIETPGFLSNYSAYNNLRFLAGINKKIGKDLFLFLNLLLNFIYTTTFFKYFLYIFTSISCNFI